jgi:putative two-component system response regulator
MAVGLAEARILIVDDEKANVRLLERILEEGGYLRTKSLTDSRQVLDAVGGFAPDLILLDLHMPHLDGFALLEALRAEPREPGFLPILVLTADITSAAKRQALAGGATDFLTKPFDQTEVLLRIRNLLETRYLHLQLQEHNQMLEAKVRERTQDLEEARMEILNRLARAAEFRDDDTGQHTRRVGETAAMLAQAMRLPEAEVEMIRRAAPLHDVGKIAIPDHILLKPGRLTPEEFEIMKTHTTIGARILGGSQVPLLHLAEAIALTHHERWDGSGYPRGLVGDAIPLAGRIVAVADVFDAMTHDRPYRLAFAVEETWEVLWDGAGSEWDPAVVEAFSTLTLSPEEEDQVRGDIAVVGGRVGRAADPRR